MCVGEYVIDAYLAYIEGIECVAYSASLAHAFVTLRTASPILILHTNTPLLFILFPTGLASRHTSARFILQRLVLTPLAVQLGVSPSTGSVRWGPPPPPPLLRPSATASAAAHAHFGAAAIGEHPLPPPFSLTWHPNCPDFLLHAARYEAAVGLVVGARDRQSVVIAGHEGGLSYRQSDVSVAAGHNSTRAAAMITSTASSSLCVVQPAHPALLVSLIAPRPSMQQIELMQRRWRRVMLLPFVGQQRGKHQNNKRVAAAARYLLPSSAPTATTVTTTTTATINGKPAASSAAVANDDNVLREDNATTAATPPNRALCAGESVAVFYVLNNAAGGWEERRVYALPRGSAVEEEEEEEEEEEVVVEEGDEDGGNGMTDGIGEGGNNAASMLPQLGKQPAAGASVDTTTSSSTAQRTRRLRFILSKDATTVAGSSNSSTHTASTASSAVEPAPPSTSNTASAASSAVEPAPFPTPGSAACLAAAPAVPVPAPPPGQSTGSPSHPGVAAAADTARQQCSELYEVPSIGRVGCTDMWSVEYGNGVWELPSTPPLPTPPPPSSTMLISDNFRGGGARVDYTSNDLLALTGSGIASPAAPHTHTNSGSGIMFSSPAAATPGELAPAAPALNSSPSDLSAVNVNPLHQQQLSSASALSSPHCPEQLQRALLAFHRTQLGRTKRFAPPRVAAYISSFLAYFPGSVARTPSTAVAGKEAPAASGWSGGSDSGPGGSRGSSSGAGGGRSRRHHTAPSPSSTISGGSSGSIGTPSLWQAVEVVMDPNAQPYASEPKYKGYTSTRSASSLAAAASVEGGVDNMDSGDAGTGAAAAAAPSSSNMLDAAPLQPAAVESSTPAALPPSNAAAGGRGRGRYRSAARAVSDSVVAAAVAPTSGIAVEVAEVDLFSPWELELLRQSPPLATTSSSSNSDATHPHPISHEPLPLYLDGSSSMSHEAYSGLLRDPVLALATSTQYDRLHLLLTARSGDGTGDADEDYSAALTSDLAARSDSATSSSSADSGSSDSISGVRGSGGGDRDSWGHFSPPPPSASTCIALFGVLRALVAAPQASASRASTAITSSSSSYSSGAATSTRRRGGTSFSRAISASILPPHSNATLSAPLITSSTAATSTTPPHPAAPLIAAHITPAVRDAATCFLAPVPSSTPLYHLTISAPMHLGAILGRLLCGYYRSMPAIRADVLAVRDNCATFNLPGSDIVVAAGVVCGALLASIDALCPPATGSLAVEREGGHGDVRVGSGGDDASSTAGDVAGAASGSAGSGATLLGGRIRRGDIIGATIVGPLLPPGLHEDEEGEASADRIGSDSAASSASHVTAASLTDTATVAPGGGGVAGETCSASSREGAIDAPADTSSSLPVSSATCVPSGLVNMRLRLRLHYRAQLQVEAGMEAVAGANTAAADDDG